ncbi:MAG: primosomal protein N' [Cyclobacteriaceae bacterium]|nr:primosomal protein N' [Cyclobacteriaceae bacterium]
MSQLELNNPNFQSRETLFANIILPIPLPKSFTYRIPVDMEKDLLIGSRVIVPFGRRKILTGIVLLIHSSPPQNYEARYILDVLDHSPIMTGNQLELIQWIASYYMCTVGEVMNIALPTGLKISSESKVQLHPHFKLDNEETPLTEKEGILISTLKQQEALTYEDISQLLGVKTIHPVIKSLIQKEAIILFEEVKEKYKPKIESRFRLTEKYAKNESLLEELFRSLEKKPKQTDILLKYLQLVSVFKNSNENIEGLPKSIIKSNSLSHSSLKTLEKNGVFEVFDKIISRFNDIPDNIDHDFQLSDDQTYAKDEILSGFNKNKTVLLHGVTGSGKTEIYISLIQDALEGGNQVLYLLPEIALTTQIVTRLRKVFGSKMGVYHSKFSDNERVEVWNGVLSGKFSLVVGVRSSVFLPFDNLGLIIVDEEHENSYKQYEPAPRYNARDVAIYMAQAQHSKVLLGSATPSIESYHNTKTEKYQLVELNNRYGEAKLPKIVLVDTLKEKKRKTLKNDFTSVLVNSVEQRITDHEQAIIFQNRRGYSPYVNCDTCGWIPKCENCSVSLTYHLYKNELSCHYCGHKAPVSTHCGACESTKIITVGYGTEKLEEDLQLIFPDINIQRMDLDTTRNKYSYQRIIDAFEKGEIDVLVGTQMVTKGLDFDKVSLVGVLDIDRMLHFPDFRSLERTFQLVTQVSGRAGRRKKQGEVVIQTNNTEQPILKLIVNNDYQKLYDSEIIERQKFNYPPFYRLISITIKNKEKKICHETAYKLVNLLIAKLGKTRILGPEEPVINKIRNQFIMKILVKLEKDKVALGKAKIIVKEISETLLQERNLKSSRVILDVDPY